MKDGKKVAIGLGIGTLIFGVILATTKKAVAGEITLQAGWNEVTYTGSAKKAGIAMQSIRDYLVIAYYYDALAGEWVQIVYDTILEPGMVVLIQVSEYCIWTF